jgi:hypothetical protein
MKGVLYDENGNRSLNYAFIRSRQRCDGRIIRFSINLNKKSCLF